MVVRSDADLRGLVIDILVVLKVVGIVRVVHMMGLAKTGAARVTRRLEVQRDDTQETRGRTMFWTCGGGPPIKERNAQRRLKCIGQDADPMLCGACFVYIQYYYAAGSRHGLALTFYL